MCSFATSYQRGAVCELTDAAGSGNLKGSEGVALWPLRAKSTAQPLQCAPILRCECLSTIIIAVCSVSSVVAIRTDPIFHLSPAGISNLCILRDPSAPRSAVCAVRLHNRRHLPVFQLLHSGYRVRSTTRSFRVQSIFFLGQLKKNCCSLVFDSPSIKVLLLNARFSHSWARIASYSALVDEKG